MTGSSFDLVHNQQISREAVCRKTQRSKIGIVRSLYWILFASVLSHVRSLILSKTVDIFPVFIFRESVHASTHQSRDIPCGCNCCCIQGKPRLSRSDRDGERHWLTTTIDPVPTVTYAYSPYASLCWTHSSLLCDRVLTQLLQYRLQ